MVQRLVLLIFTAQVFMAGMLLVPAPAAAQIDRGDYCQPEIEGFFGLPTWYKYLLEDNEFGTEECEVEFSFTDPLDYVAVGLAAFEILMRIAGMVVLGFVMYGAFQLLTSGGESEKYAAARTTITNALIGLVIALSAVVVVNLIGNTI